ncbi:MAG: rRNA ((2503)-C(2))-methyltransferase RlmN, partial [Verrucomicrobiaceae bacterium]|nr:rRNA ((2503)-C(2))-methyltransferase RlmN [Verrucomicrobiaceae bacterium]
MSVSAVIPPKQPILGLTQARLVELLAEWQEPSYRAAQILDWVFKRRVLSFDKMSNLSRSLRARLEEHFTLRSMNYSSVTGSHDTTRKFLFKLHDGRYV